MPDVALFLGGGFFGATDPNASSTVALPNGVIIPARALADISPVTELALAAVNTGAAGVVFTHTFYLRVPYSISVAARLRTKLRWVINTSTAAGVTGRFQVTVKKQTGLTGSVDAIPGLVSGLGAVRACDAAGGTEYQESQIIVDIPATTFTGGDALVIEVAFKVVQAVVGAGGAIGLRCDPNVDPNQLVFEFDVGQQIP